MKKKILFLSMFFLAMLVLPSVKADVITTCEIGQDVHVDRNNPTTNYGTSPNMQVNRNPNQRSYVQANLSNCSIPLSSIASVVYAEICFFTGTINRQMNTTIYLVNDSYNNFGGLNETSMTWNNQPCGSGFNNTANCSFTPLNTTYLVSANVFYCYNVTDSVRTYWMNDQKNITFVIANTTTGLGGIDYLRSKEFSTPADLPELNITYLIQTNLTLTNPLIFPLSEYTLVQANYTVLATKETVENATCEFKGDAGEGVMSYNNSTGLHEILVLPETSGVYSFNVTCSADEYFTQFENKSATAQYLAGTPYNLSVYLWENKNATTPYIDEFAWIVMVSHDFNCTLITGENNCYFHSRYKNGEANLTLYSNGNYTTYLYSGELSFANELSSPRFHSLNDLTYLGSFVIEQDQERLDLWVDVLQINFWLATQRFLLTYGVLIFIVLVGLGVGIGLLYFDTGFITAMTSALLVIGVLLVVASSVFNLDFSITNLLSLILT